jgi:excisionase family DNA binding protein
MSSNDNDAVFTVTELAAKWKCSRRSVLEAIREGRLAAFCIGKRAFRVSRAEVLRYEAARRAAEDAA